MQFLHRPVVSDPFQDAGLKPPACLAAYLHLAACITWSARHHTGAWWQANRGAHATQAAGYCGLQLQLAAALQLQRSVQHLFGHKDWKIAA
jgi:hypothetical protein